MVPCLKVQVITDVGGKDDAAVLVNQPWSQPQLERCHGGLSVGPLL
jgi:hypothetical protein